MIPGKAGRIYRQLKKPKVVQTLPALTRLTHQINIDIQFYSSTQTKIWNFLHFPPRCTYTGV
jgi:hypothetical protein